MLRYILPAVAALSLAACSPQQIAQVQATNAKVIAAAQVVCKADASAQPIVVPLAAATVTAVAPGAAAPVAGAVALDNSIVHPAVTAACAAVGGLPVAVVPAPAPAVAAAK